MCDGLLDSVCRLCLKNNFSLKRIFNCPSSSNEPLFRIMEKIYDLKICEGDGLPSKICVPCMWKVLEFDTYRKNVRHAEEELRKLLSRTLNESNEVSEEGTGNITELTAEKEMNVASDPMEGIDNDTEVSIKNEIDIVEWEMPQDVLPEEDILENVKSEAGEEVVKETESVIEIEEQEEDIQPEKDTSKVSAGIDFKYNYAENDGQTEELEDSQSSESCNVNSSECLGQVDKNFENVSLIYNSSVVNTSGISGKNKANEEMCGKSIKDDLFIEEESFLSLKSKSGCNAAETNSSSSEIAVQDKKKPFVCDICKKSFVSKWHLSRHVKIHYNDRPFKCRECGKSFKQVVSKIVHELRHLKKQKKNAEDEKSKTKKSRVCEICKKEFSSRQSLHKHSNLHKNKYSCTFCGKRYGSKHNLNRHSRIHSNEKPFSCEVCKKTFNQKESLKIHITTHSDNRCFQCNVCDKRFKTRQHKNQHELYHLRNK